MYTTAAKERMPKHGAGVVEMGLVAATFFNPPINICKFGFCVSNLSALQSHDTIANVNANSDAPQKFASEF